MRERAFIILIDGSPAVTIVIDDIVGRMPTQILDDYSKEYGIDRAKLGWSLTFTIPMPGEE